MKQFFNAFIMCQSMFCAIPCPLKIWDETARDKQLLFLPLIGTEIGVLWFAIAKLCMFLNIPHFLTAFILAVYPFVISGYIHLDGFMDVTDAVKSCRNLEKRREILKDSRVGAFAVMGCVLLVTGQFAAFASMDFNGITALVFIPVVSRLGSSLALNTLKKINQSQYIGFVKNKKHIAVLTIMFAVTAACSYIFCKKYVFAVWGVILGYIFALYKGYKNLDGVNGDVAGYALTVSEFCGILVLALL